MGYVEIRRLGPNEKTAKCDNHPCRNEGPIQDGRYLESNGEKVLWFCSFCKEKLPR